MAGSSRASELPFPIVGVGASAGGLEALQRFLSAMPPQPGFAVVVVTHLDAKQKSALPELLQACTTLPVAAVDDDMLVQPDHIYVICPGQQLRLEAGRLRTGAAAATGVIDVFLRSLAADRGERAACVILSGGGSDGALGLRAIKGEAGLALVQDESATFGEMPRNALLSGLVDRVLPPQRMPQQIVDYFSHASALSLPEQAIDSPQARAYPRILALLRRRTGHDFSMYKANTLQRRIERRMTLHLFDELDDYVEMLERDEIEVDALFRDLLIGVTRFFRDAGAFEALGAALEQLLADKTDDQPIRVWVPGCSTGEEAYSIAILLHECAERAGRRVAVQIFGTDIDPDAIEAARKGVYPQSIEADVSSERLRRYFAQEDSGDYRLNATIREMLVFAEQNVAKDPPFSRLDLLACRNLLIYLSSKLQKHLFSVFYYALRPRGLLLLGSSESVGDSELFTPLDRRQRLFARALDAGRPDVDVFRLRESRADNVVPAASRHTVDGDKHGRLLAHTILQQSDAPPCAIVDRAMNVVYIHGHTGRFLEPPQGEVSVNIVEMARPGLRTALAGGLQRAMRSGDEVQQRGVTLVNDDGVCAVDLAIKPVLEPPSMAGMAIVFFSLQPGAAEAAASPPLPPSEDDEPALVVQLRRQLIESQEALQSTIEELQTSNEELKSANEELQSTNEELQSSNEELQTSKEELQSVNEEATTVNAELAGRIDMLARANDDLKNLLDSTGIATIFLDLDGNVRRFTPTVAALIPLTARDLGRPLRHFATSLLDVDLAEIASAVLDDLVIRERETATSDGTFFLLRVRPYRTAQNVIDGTVLTFEDRTAITLAERVLEQTSGAD